jgi:hypothetical protein
LYFHLVLDNKKIDNNDINLSYASDFLSSFKLKNGNRNVSANINMLDNTTIRASIRNQNIPKQGDLTFNCD